ncbi:MAG: LamG-like jellyroll fold domain-containing protein, partial [Verrucomicrobiota bacterium]
KVVAPAGHNGGPVPMMVDGVPCVAIHHFDGLLVVRLDRGREGETVAEVPWRTDFGNNVATPAVRGNAILLTSSYNHHRMARYDISLNGATRVWEQKAASKVCSPIIHRGSVYWAWRQMVCLDFETGEKRWTGGRYGDAGSCIMTGDDRLIVWANRGDLSLVESAVRSPDAYSELARRKVLSRSDAWPHVVLSDRRLFCKDRKGSLVCFDLRASPSAPRPPEPVKPFNLRSDLVFGWVGGSAQPRPAASMTPRGDARFDAEGIRLEDGAVVVEGAEAWLHTSFRKSPAFSLEVVLRTDSLNQRGPARIISQSKDAYHRNFTLGQDGAWLVLRIRTTKTDDNGRRHETRLCRLDPKQPQHVVVTYRDGMLVSYLNGKAASRSEAIEGNLANWDAYGLLFGDEWNGDRTWKGRLQRVA